MENKLIKVINNKEATLKFIHSFIKTRIKKIIGDKELGFSIEDLLITEYPKIDVNFLVDKRTIEEDDEYNEQGVNLRRKINKSDISVFDYKIKRYSFADVDNETIFRVKDTEDTFLCKLCNGKKVITCRICHGSGKNKCSKCNGNGQIKCSSCNGRGEFKCSSCNGKGVKNEGYSDNKRTISCSSCGGRGAKKCTRCNNGWNTCSKCRGKGEITCTNCSGRGIVTCYHCEGHGSFNKYLFVRSKIGIENITQFIKGNPSLDYITVSSNIEEFDYDNRFNFDLKSLKEYSTNFKSLFERYQDSANKRSFKISFSKSICYSIEFNVLINNNKFKFIYASNDFKTDSNFDSSIFYSFISSIPIDKDFNALKQNKEYLSSKIEKPVEKIFNQIKEYDTFKRTIISNETNSTKLIKIRNLKIINTLKYDIHLQKKLIKRNNIINAILVLLCFFVLLFLNNFYFVSIIIIGLGISIGYLFSYLIFKKKIKKLSFTNSFSIALIILILFMIITSYLSITFSIN